MDDIKSKVLDFIKPKSQLKIPIVGDRVNEESIEEVDNYQSSIDFAQVDQPSDHEILQTIGEDYFLASSAFDASRTELEKCCKLEDIEELENSLSRLKKQHNVVSNQVLQMILEKQSASLQEFDRVVELETAVGLARDTAADGRRSLSLAASYITTASLAILTNSRKRMLIRQLLNSLHSIATLRETELKGETKLESGDLTGAIRLLVECLRTAGSFRHFSCVASLSSKLQDTLVMAEEHLDQTISKVCYGFDKDLYSELESAYRVIGKSQAALDQLLMHFTSSIHNSAYSTVRAFVNLPDSSKPEYSQLCKLVSEDEFLECLTTLCKALWYILLSYYHLINWHLSRSSSDLPGNRIEDCYRDEYSRQKLEGGRSRLWHDVQSRVSCLVLSTSLVNYKFDDFLHFLALLHRLSQIGEELCGEIAGRHGDELASSIRTQSKQYFSKYHNARLEDLKEIFDNEPWTPCPIRKHFNLLHLQEWRGLQTVVEQCMKVSQSQSLSETSSVETGPTCSLSSGFFSLHPEPSISTPFDNTSFSSSQEHILQEDTNDGKNYSSEDSDDEIHLRYDNILVGNTTLTVLRLCGKYLQMARYLDSIVEDVVSALCQLFEYYLYTVHKIFSADSYAGEACKQMAPSIKLVAVLKRIKESLFEITTDQGSTKLIEEESMFVDLNKGFYGLEERAVGVESLMFLSEQYNILRPYLEQLLNNNNSSLHKLNQFYTQTVAVSSEIRSPVYWCVAKRAVNINQILTSMTAVDWDLKEVISQHSSYVDVIFSEVEDFATRLGQIRIAGRTPLTAPVILSIWDSVSYLLANLFVEGFGSTRKCSNGGRALMQLDWAQLLSKFSQLCPLRPIPHISYVETYIKAYYQPEQELLLWIKQHFSEYSGKQLVGLICSACQADRKSRLRLTAALEQLAADPLNLTANYR